jgi:hypothetical protein
MKTRETRFGEDKGVGTRSIYHEWHQRVAPGPMAANRKQTCKASLRSGKARTDVPATSVTCLNEKEADQWLTAFGP